MSFLCFKMPSSISRASATSSSICVSFFERKDDLQGSRFFRSVGCLLYMRAFRLAYSNGLFCGRGRSGGREHAALLEDAITSQSLQTYVFLRLWRKQQVLLRILLFHASFSEVNVSCRCRETINHLSTFSFDGGGWGGN